MSLKHMVVTYVAQSRRLPHLKGVFANRSLKQFTPIEIIPHAYSVKFDNNVSSKNNHASENNSLGDSRSSTMKMAGECSLSSCKEMECQWERKNNSIEKEEHTLERVIHAPPFVCNLITAPQHTISLRRFLALRHQFHKDHFLHITAEHGWYLLAPSYALGLHDEAGLKAWAARHHSNYNTSPPTSIQREKWEEKSEFTNQSFDTSTTQHGALHTNKQVTNMFELSEDDLEQIAQEEAMENDSNLEAVTNNDSCKCESNEDEESEEEEEEEEEEILEEEYQKQNEVKMNDDWTCHAVNSVKSKENTINTPYVNSSSLQHFKQEQQKNSSFVQSTEQNADNVIPSITEEQLFEINDGVHWTLPPHDDLASTQYWKTFKDRMYVYEHNDGWDRDEYDKFVEHYMSTHSSINTISRSSCIKDDDKKKTNKEELEVETEKEMFDKAHALFEALTFKANVALQVEPNSLLVTLITLKTIDPNEELCLHYGREWWTTRLLSRLFCSASDAELKKLRWIESVCASETDEFEPFPLITLRSTHKHHTSTRLNKSTETENTEQEEEKETTVVMSNKTNEPSLFERYYLYNTVTRSRAKDHAVVAYAIRRSCIDLSFLKLLLHGQEEHIISIHKSNDDNSKNTKVSFSAVFDIRACDAEVPLRRIRRALLLSLYLEQQNKVSNTNIVQSVTSNKDKTTLDKSASRINNGEIADINSEREFDV